MSALRTKVLLREYVKAALREDGGGDYGGFGFGDMGGMGGGGMGAEIVSGDQLYDIFVQPFANAIGHIAGKTKELSQRGITLLKVAFEAVMTSIIPILKDDYGQIFADEKNELDKIKGEFGHYYQATWDAFKNDDLCIAAFMYRPDLFLTVDLVQKAPKAAAKLLSVLSGGALDNVLHRLVGDSDGDQKKHEGLIREGADEAEQLKKLIANKKVHQVLASSQLTQQTSKAGQQIARHTLKQVFDKAQAVMSAKTLDELQKKAGKKLPGLDKLSQVPQQERQKAEQEMMSAIKKSMKLFYSKELEGHVKAAIRAGVPENHPFIHDFRSVIGKIKAL